MLSSVVDFVTLLRNTVLINCKAMGRPREHDDQTAAALLEAAERLVESSGPDALTVRGVAERAGTTTRAVYGLFGSKDALLVALATRAFEILGTGIRRLPTTADPVADLVEAGIAVFRRFALDHPSLFRIAIQRDALSDELVQGFRSAGREALAELQRRVARLGHGDGTLYETLEFHALCEGLAALELRGVLPDGREEQLWRHALTALITGFALPHDAPRRRAPSRRR
jgi:AcrR family transcriptional regulator